ncbi:hypothetical protein [Colwellia ponticola]|nr:hypothetical protein [Colwellia ponticola]
MASPTDIFGIISILFSSAMSFKNDGEVVQQSLEDIVVYDIATLTMMYND